MRKAIIIATVGRFFGFLRSDIELLKKHGYEVHVATNLHAGEHDNMEDFDVIKHQIDFSRSPFSSSNFMAYRQLRDLLKKEKFDLVHCHTPVGGILGRFTAKKYRRTGTKVFYTAHGFHFYKGAPAKNWILFYTAEWLSSFWTDTLITICQEDYKKAGKGFHAKRICYIPGIGVDVEGYSRISVDEERKRSELGVGADDFMILMVGELSNRKNQDVVIEALGKLQLENIKVFICGEGDLRQRYLELIKQFHLERSIFLLGQREDIGELCTVADLFIIPSQQEGVSVALMEAVACKTPVFSSKIRGSVDLIHDDSCMFDSSSVEELEQLMLKKFFGGNNGKRVDRKSFKERMKKSVEQNYEALQPFDIKNVAKLTEEIYFGNTKTK